MGSNENIKIEKENVTTLLDKKYIKVFDLQYEPGKHYFDATRRSLSDLVAVKDGEEFKHMTPDAVSCLVILAPEGAEPKLLLTYEYRYPAGQFLLSVPAGLIDPADREEECPQTAAARREIKEETGLELTDEDRIFMANPLLFSTPGMTDESNGLVCAVIRSFKPEELSQNGAVGSEKFDGFELVTKANADRILRQGRDDHGIFYSIFTWAAMMWFLSDRWKEALDA